MQPRKQTKNGVTVNFSATCGTVTIVSSNQGRGCDHYKSIDAAGKLCEGTQTITAIGSNVPKQTVTVNIVEIKADSLRYSSESTVNLGIKRSGSASSGQIEFTLLCEWYTCCK